MAGHSVFYYEKIVKEVYARDKTSPELYVALYDLAHCILSYKRMVYTEEAKDEIAHTCATDMFMKISTGKLEVVCWTRYVQLRLLTHRSQYFDMTKKCQFDIKDAIKLDDFTHTLYSSSRFSLSKESSLEADDFIEYLPTFLLEQYDKVVKYRKNTREYNDILTSVLCSIAHKETVVIDKRIESEREYIEFLVKALLKRVHNYIYKTGTADQSCDSDVKDVIEQCDFI